MKLSLLLEGTDCWVMSSAREREPIGQPRPHEKALSDCKRRGGELRSARLDERGRGRWDLESGYGSSSVVLCLAVIGFSECRHRMNPGFFFSGHNPNSVPATTSHYAAVAPVAVATAHGPNLGLGCTAPTDAIGAGKLAKTLPVEKAEVPVIPVLGVLF
ncbi:hypothetical protein SKAU_G00192040 [Synaphobranchus kaupii]|uniref:Uncharacterized protein n=1 Tax=Synaphobranchus kaupii TaxID=118154 RepID=A0A9Q1IXH9_SYNKA|nr:hypothetical protein SKAU_G00192040 [Synaphobranchus kaupii]